MTRESFSLPTKESKRRFLEEVREFDTEEAETEKIPKDLVSTFDLVKKYGVSLYEIYDWYAAAITRKNREPLEEERFVGHFEGYSTDPTFAFGDKEKGFLLGYVKYGVFIPTHFAPKTIRGGYELMRELGDSTSTPAVMAVTEDLMETVSKIPSWNLLDLGFLSKFREDTVEKKIMYNSHPNTRNLMLGLIDEYLQNS